MNLDGPAFTDGIDLFVGLSLDVHAIGITPQSSGDPGLEFRRTWRDLRTLTDHGRVEVADRKAPTLHPGDGLLEEDPRVLTFVPRIGVRKQATDVRFPQGAEDGIGHRVQQRIPVGMSHRTRGMVESDSPQDEGPSPAFRRECFEPMQVVAMTDTHDDKCTPGEATRFADQGYHVDCCPFRAGGFP